MPSKRPTRLQRALRRDIESNHGLWVRNDVWYNLKSHSLKTGITIKQLVNEALYDFLIREKIELKTGINSPYDDTTYDPERGTLRKDEADSYIKED